MLRMLTAVSCAPEKLPMSTYVYPFAAVAFDGCLPPMLTITVMYPFASLTTFSSLRLIIVFAPFMNDMLQYRCCSLPVSEHPSQGVGGVTGTLIRMRSTESDSRLLICRLTSLVTS